MPKIVSVKEDVGHYEEPWLVMDIQPGEIAGQDEGARVLVDFVVDDDEDVVHIHDAVDGEGKHILRDLPPKLLKRWERDLADAGKDEEAESGSDEKSDSKSDERSDSKSDKEETVPDTKSDAEKDYEGFNFAKEETPDPFLACLGSFAHLDGMAKDKAAQPGEVRQRGGNRFQKQPDGSWKKVGGGADAHAPSAAPESEDYSEEDPRRQQRAQHREGQDRAEAQHLDAAEEARHERHEQHDPHEKVMIDPVEMIKAKAQPGETRDWGGQKYKKQPDGSWKKLSDSGPGGGGGPSKPPAAPKPPKVPKDRHAQILVGRYIQSRELGDTAGAKAIMRRLHQVVPHGPTRHKLLMQHGDPDHPVHGPATHAAVQSFLDTVPTDEMVSVMRRVP